MEHAINAGRKAVNDFQKDFFTIGEDFDALIYNFNKPLLQTASPKYWMSTMLYSTDQSDTLGTILKGEWIVKENKHRLQNEIDSAFTEKMNALKARR
jgi:formimidoylglutamate deiminase